MLTRGEVEHTLKTLKPILEQQFYVHKIGYFGSFADGSQTNDSDVDILVEFSKPVGWGFFDLSDFLETQLKRKVDLVSSKALKSQLKDIILKQVVYI